MFVAVDLATGKAVSLSETGWCVRELQVAPDGAALIASQCSGAPACTVASVTVPSGQTTLITEPSTETPFSHSGAVAPDNRTLAHIANHSFQGQAGPTDLVLTDRDGSNPRVVWQGSLGTVAFAPDGAQLAVTMSSQTSAAAARDEDIWVLGIDASNPRLVTAGHNPAWRPGGAPGR
jgi:hypothetical protein